jgi:hypothetical protein
MPLTPETLKNLTPTEAMLAIQSNISTKENAKKTILFASKRASSIEKFRETLVITKPEFFENRHDYEHEQFKDIESFYVYGGYILANGEVGGCYIEKYKNNEGYLCVVTNDSISTDDLKEAEAYLYENWYKHEYID